MCLCVRIYVRRRGRWTCGLLCVLSLFLQSGCGDGAYGEGEGEEEVKGKEDSDRLELVGF